MVDRLGRSELYTPPPHCWERTGECTEQEREDDKAYHSDGVDAHCCLLSFSLSACSETRTGDTVFFKRPSPKKKNSNSNCTLDNIK